MLFQRFSHKPNVESDGLIFIARDAILAVHEAQVTKNKVDDEGKLVCNAVGLVQKTTHLCTFIQVTPESPDFSGGYYVLERFPEVLNMLALVGAK